MAKADIHIKLGDIKGESTDKDHRLDQYPVAAIASLKLQAAVHP